MPDEDRVEEILAEWQIAKDRGVAARPETVIRKHPEHAAGLREAFSLLGALDQVFSAESPGEDPPPERIGPYRVRERLGTGGMGTVYRAVVETRAAGLDEGTVVALKLVHAHLLQRPGFFKRFLREAEIGRSVEHPNVVRTFDADALVQDGRHLHFLVMEYVQGQTLGGLLRELERVPEELCRHIAGEVAKGLAAIHEAGVVHRDLKPENVLITPDHQVKVMDLGVAHLQAEAVRLSQTGAFVGSLEYAAPEQFQTSDGEPDGRADLHSLGVVLYELATGAHPFRDEDASKVLHNILEVVPRKAGEVNPQLSPFFEEMVHTLLGKDREERFAAASDLVRVLGEDEDSEWWKERARALRVETKRPLRRIRIPRETALYGRDDDLAWMRKAYRQAKAGDGRVLLIEGEAGIGKTRLVDEFVGQLRQEGEDLNFLFGSYPPGGAATAAGAFSTAYREHFGGEGLEESVAPYVTETPGLVPAFAALLRGESPLQSHQALTKDALQTVFVRVTQALSSERPTVVLIDDLHFAPAEGRALFSSLAMAAPGHRVLLLGTMRPGVPADWTSDLARLEHASMSVLARLGAKDLARLLEDAFRSERLATELGHRIAVKSDGNPFFAFEIIRGLREGQFLRQAPDGTWMTTQIIDEIQVPSTVLDLVNARVADLAREERDVLEIAACCGFDFDPTLVCEAAGVAQLEGLRVLGQVERRYRLVRGVGRQFAFDHHQVQEALYLGLSEMLRETYHLEVAGALERRTGGPEADASSIDPDVCVQLCRHYFDGAQPARAARVVRPALAHLSAEHLHSEVVALAKGLLVVPGALAGPERLEILLQGIESADTAGDRGQQRAFADEAVALAAEVGDDALSSEACRKRGLAASRERHFEEAIADYERAVAHARKAGDREGEAFALAHMAGCEMGIGAHPQRGRDLASQAWQIASAAGTDRAAGLALLNLTYAQTVLGDAEAAAESGKEAVAAHRRAGDLRFEAIARLNLAAALHSLGRTDEVAVELEAARSAARRVGDRATEARTLGGMVTPDAEIWGDVDARDALLSDAIRLSQEVGDEEWAAAIRMTRAHAWWQSWGVAEALAELEAIYDSAGTRQSPLHRGVIGFNLAAKYLELGAHGKAAPIVEEAVELLEDIGARRELAYTLHVRGIVRAADGDWQAALATHESAYALRRQIQYEPGYLNSLLNLGRAAMGAGEEAKARGYFAQAFARAEEEDEGLAVLLSSRLAALGVGSATAVQVRLEAHEAQGGASHGDHLAESHYFLWRATGQDEHLAAARRSLESLWQEVPDPYRESFFDGVPLHREIMEAWASLDPEFVEGEHGDPALSERSESKGQAVGEGEAG